MPGDWQNDLPFLTPERIRDVVERDGARWHRAVSTLGGSGHPRLGFRGAEDFTRTIARLADARDSETVRHRADLRNSIEEILYRRWLRVYDHHPERIERNGPLLGFPVPGYRTPEELTGGTLTRQDALQELWQRDIGDALPALALAAHLFPDIAELCRERMKAFVLASLEFPTWGAWQPLYADMDLSVDHIARGIAMAYDWHRDLWSDSERDRIVTVLRRKLGTLLRGAYGAAFWARGWTDNHCQNAFATLGICGAAFQEEIEEAEEWLGAAVAGFEIALPLCNPDGSSAEGVPYWGYGMTFLLSYIELTRVISGADALYESPYLRNALAYRLHCSLPDLSGTLTFGDALARDYYGPAHILYALARQYRDGAAQWLGDAITLPNRSGADIEAWALLWRDPTLTPDAPADLPTDYHLPSWDVATTRSGWAPDDYVLAVKSGYTNRNHSHLDTGALLFGWGGEWLIEAPGYGDVGPGFWDTGGPRWEYYSNSTESHTTLLIDGRNQSFSPSARGTITEFHSEGNICRIMVDLSAAYVGGQTVTRRILHRRGVYILVLDEIEASGEGASPFTAEWLLQPGRGCAVSESAGAGDPAVWIRGRVGALAVRPLAPADTRFTQRHPTMPYIDIPESAIRTLALSSEGGISAAFAVLLLPQNGQTGGESAEETVTARVELWTSGNRKIAVEGPGFRDSIDTTMR